MGQRIHGGSGRRRGRHSAPRRGHRGLTICGLVAIALAASVGVYLLPGPSVRARSTGMADTAVRQEGAGAAKVVALEPESQQVTPSSITRPGELTGPGPLAAVRSRAIIAENAKPGSSAWRIGGEPSDGFIQGFADTTYASVGQTVRLFVSTSAPTFTASAYRMGWYGGAGGRQVWQSALVEGRTQPRCVLDHATNMVSCDDWSASLDVPITSAFVQGDYLFKLTASSGNQSYVLLTVWDPDSTAAFLVMSRSLTEQGWNTFGGYSYYAGKGSCILGQSSSYPTCDRARVVSFDRPYDSGFGASDFLSNEYPLVQLMEKQGLDVAYCTDITVDEHPASLLSHKAILSLGHDETWTYNEREAAQVALDHGVNMFFGAAAVLRHSRLEPSLLGPDRQEVDYRDAREDPLSQDVTLLDRMQVTGNTWSSPPSSWSEIPFTGQEYSGYLNGDATAPFVVHEPSSWVFAGTGLKQDSMIPDVVMSDIDHLDPSAGSPADIEVLGHSPIPLKEAFTSQGEWDGETYSDMTYYTDPESQAGVIDTGTVNWIYALSLCSSPQHCPAPLVTDITDNILAVFGLGPAGQSEPSVPNWKVLRPHDS